MSVRVALNGFGRIGRAIFRSRYEAGNDHGLEIVAVNDLAPLEINALLLARDTVHGPFEGVTADAGDLVCRGDRIRYFSEKDPEKLPWRELGIDLVLECTGRFESLEGAEKHLKAGAGKVLISAPGKNVQRTVARGVNDHLITPTDRIVSNGSCTTNCLAPVLAVLEPLFHIESGFITTIHSITNNQVLIDVAHKDPRRARCAFENMIPTGTHAAQAVGLVVPGLAGKLDGIAVRVPTSNVSLIDVSLVFEQPVSAEEINAALVKASESERLKGILACTGLPLVSSDFNNDPHSCTVDLLLTKTNGRHAKLSLWYDNEWGFSHRMLEVAELMTRSSAA